MVQSTWAIVAGGGTAGHVEPGLAISRALVARGHAPESILYAGSRRGIDARMLPPSGFPFVLLPGRGLARKITVDNVVALIGFAVGLIRAVVIVGRRRPKVAVSLGGYAAAPCGLAARLWGVPLVLAEQNAVPTMTHRLLARFARASAVAFDDTPLPHATVTGNPVRDEILAVDSTAAGALAARRRLGLPERGIVIAAVGGSLGSRTINAAVVELAAAWHDRSDVAIRHVVGRRDWDEFGSAVDTSGGGLFYQAVQYEEHMGDVLGAADVVISRAGGATVSELAAVGRASLLVPLPIAPYDHQAANAQVFVRAGAAVMVRDHEVTGGRLASELDQLLAEPGRPARMGEAARTLSRRDAADRVAALVENVAKP